MKYLLLCLKSIAIISKGVGTHIMFGLEHDTGFYTAPL